MEISAVLVDVFVVIKAEYLSDQVAPRDGLYVPMGSTSVVFAGNGDDEARFYLISAAAHRPLPLKKITPDEAKPLERRRIQPALEEKKED